MTSTPITSDDLQNLARRFEFHGANIYGSADPHNNSPLYSALSLEVARDPDVLALLLEADQATTVTNLLLGAVHYLLLKSTAEPLARYYRSLSDAPLPPQEAYLHFREFCLKHAVEIRELVTSRRIQTNEVGRCTALVPAFEHIRQAHAGKPLALIEVGSSAGLLLLWDQYRYDYHPGGLIGAEDALVQLSCEMRGGTPPLPTAMPKIIWRRGIDLNPLDVNDADAMLWLRALIWPEQIDRARQLEQAVTVARQNPVRLLRGNALDLLPPVIAQVPVQAHLVIFHSYTLNQIPPTLAADILDVIRQASGGESFTRLSLEWWGGEPLPKLEMIEYADGKTEHTLLGVCESHGRWLEWQHAV